MFLIAGPCAIEGRQMVLDTAAELQQVCRDLDIQLYFKSSFDKANRTSSSSSRGVGMSDGLRILAEVKQRFGLPILTDVHESCQCAPVAEVADVLQIPGTVNIKKGQFMAPWDMRGAISKCRDANPDAPVWLTERGSSFGYGNLVVDMTSLVRMREYGCPVIFDATHSVQQPSSQQGITGGNRELVPPLMRAALAVGIDGLFLEVHPDPDHAISDAANQVRLADIRAILTQAKAFDTLAHQYSN